MLTLANQRRCCSLTHTACRSGVVTSYGSNCLVPRFFRALGCLGSPSARAVPLFSSPPPFPRERRVVYVTPLLLHEDLRRPGEALNRRKPSCEVGVGLPLWCHDRAAPRVFWQNRVICLLTESSSALLYCFCIVSPRVGRVIS